MQVLGGRPPLEGGGEDDGRRHRTRGGVGGAAGMDGQGLDLHGSPLMKMQVPGEAGALLVGQGLVRERLAAAARRPGPPAGSRSPGAGRGSAGRGAPAGSRGTSPAARRSCRRIGSRRRSGCSGTRTCARPDGPPRGRSRSPAPATTGRPAAAGGPGTRGRGRGWRGPRSTPRSGGSRPPRAKGRGPRRRRSPRSLQRFRKKAPRATALTERRRRPSRTPRLYWAYTPGRCRSSGRCPRGSGSSPTGPGPWAGSRSATGLPCACSSRASGSRTTAPS